jgi:hypothetical protein
MLLKKISYGSLLMSVYLLRLSSQWWIICAAEFLREVRLLASLEDENIARVLAVSTASGRRRTTHHRINIYSSYSTLHTVEHSIYWSIHVLLYDTLEFSVLFLYIRLHCILHTKLSIQYMYILPVQHSFASRTPENIVSSTLGYATSCTIAILFSLE